VKLFLLRPQPGADASASRARAAGFDPIIVPMFHVVPVEWHCPEQSFDGLLITSANGIRHAGAQLSALRDLPVLAVGNASADAAQQAGFGVPLVGKSGAMAVLEQANGADYIPLDPSLVVNVTARIVYRSRPIEPAPNFAEWLDMDSIVALHSPRAARYFGDYCDRSGKDRATISLAALSLAVADAAGSGWRVKVIASAPNDAALLSAAHSIVRGDSGQPKG
jgi:uroporphyrinogen-III synthase